MPGRILTSHAGSFPRPDDLVALNFERMEGRFGDESAYQRKLTQAVEELVAPQREIGIDLVNDGEYGHSMGHRYDYGSRGGRAARERAAVRVAHARLDVARAR